MEATTTASASASASQASASASDIQSTFRSFKRLFTKCNLEYLHLMSNYGRKIEGVRRFQIYKLNTDSKTFTLISNDKDVACLKNDDILKFEVDKLYEERKAVYERLFKIIQPKDPKRADNLTNKMIADLEISELHRLLKEYDFKPYVLEERIQKALEQMQKDEFVDVD